MRRSIAGIVSLVIAALPTAVVSGPPPDSRQPVIPTSSAGTRDWLDEASARIRSADFAFRFSEADRSWSARNPDQGIVVGFDGTTLSLTPGSEDAPGNRQTSSLRLRLPESNDRTSAGRSRWGRPHVDGARLEVRGDAVTAWIANEPDGVTLGLAVQGPLDPDRPESSMTLGWDVGKDLLSQPSEDGDSVLWKSPSGVPLFRAFGPVVSTGAGEPMPRDASRRSRPFEVRLTAAHPRSSLRIEWRVVSPAGGPIAGGRSGPSRYRVHAAGDVDGDGYSDVVVVAPRPGTSSVPRVSAYAFRGSPSGLSTRSSWSTAEILGASTPADIVVGTGDVNGDGYDDVLVSDPGFDCGAGCEGRVLVFLGSTNGLIPMPAWAIQGDEKGAEFGFSAAIVADVDGDGYDDVLVGAPSHSNGAIAGAGSAYLYRGRAQSTQTSSGWPQSPAPDWTYRGTGDQARLGFAVASAGDVNGDGRGDVLLALLGATSAAGQALLFEGSSQGLAAGPDWTSPPVFRGDDYPFGPFISVSGLGDVDGDGFGDFSIGGNRASSPTLDVFVGSDSGPSLLGTLDCVLPLGEARPRGHARAATVGDFNGDGYADIVVGYANYSLTTARIDNGAACLFLGGHVSAGVPWDSAWTVVGDVGSRFGTDLGTVGDVNGDGFSDFEVEDRLWLGFPQLYRETPDVSIPVPFLWVPAGDIDADGYDDLAIFDPYVSGIAEVFRGRAGGPDPSGAPTWTLPAGSSLSAGTDIDGDGYDDLVSLSFSDASGTCSLVVHRGSSEGPDPASSWTVPVPVCGSGTVTCDVNGDGFGDVLVDGRLFLGSPSGLAPASWETGASGEQAVACLGDANGDGFSDVVTKARIGTEPNAPVGFRLQSGSPGGLSPAPTAFMTGISWSTLAASAGDVDGDGCSDLLLGDPFDLGAGSVFLFSGSALSPLGGPVWKAGGGAFPPHFGYVTSPGDVNRDGFTDILAARNDDTGDQPVTNLEAYAWLGSANGPASSPGWASTAMPFIDSPFVSIDGIGDVNGDGFPDLAISSPGSFLSNRELFLGNGGGGLPRAIRQIRRFSDAPIGLRGTSDSETSFRLRGFGRTPYGRGKVRLEWEVKPFGAPFDGRGISHGEWIDTGQPMPDVGSMSTAIGTVEGLRRARLYHWRARVASVSPMFPHSPWFWPSRAGASEAHLRTMGVPDFGPYAPPEGILIYPDTEPPDFRWYPAQQGRYRLEWSRTATFDANGVLTEGDLAGVSQFTPPTDRWREILDLGRKPEPTRAPVYWRVVATNTDGTTQQAAPPRVLVIERPLPPTLTGPVDGASVFRSAPPTIVWDANHNERFRIVFSSKPNLGQPKVTYGGDYQLRGNEAAVPTDVWGQVCSQVAPPQGGPIYVAVFAKDALDRRTFTEVRSLVVVPF